MIESFWTEEQMVRSNRIAATAAMVALVLSSTAQRVSAQRMTRRLFVRVTDGSGQLVSGLTPADIRLTEGGVAREVTRVAADVPMRVILLVDSTNAVAQNITQFRSGLQAFYDGLPPALEVGFMTTGGQLKIRVPPGTDRQKLRSEFQLFSAESGGNAIIESLLEADTRFLKNAPDRWPVFVLVTNDTGASRGEAPIDRYNRFMNDYLLRGGSAHAVVIGGTQTGIISDIVSNLVTNAGGILETMTISNALPDKMKALAARLAADQTAMAGRYEIQYTSDAKAKPGAPIELAVATRTDIRVSMSARRPF